jgi:hypothetical protein
MVYLPSPNPINLTLFIPPPPTTIAVTAQLAYDDLYDPSLSQSTYVSHVSAYSILTGITSLLLALFGLGSLVGKIDKEVRITR